MLLLVSCLEPQEKQKHKHFLQRAVCLCSYYSVQDIRPRKIKLEEKEALFLTKTFPRLGNGRITLDIDSAAGGEYFFDALNILPDFDLFEDF